jgi:hypothetical protein
MKHLVLILFAAVCYGQVSSGSLIGDVKDESSSAVAGAVVTAENRATGLSRSATTNASGSYRIDDLIPGIYSMQVQRAGMRPLTVPKVTVEVDQRSRLDIAMQSGEERDAVTVNAHSSPIQTEEASDGYQLGSGMMEALPLANRNIISMVTLGPGAIPRQLGGFTHDIINDKQANRGAVALNAPVNGSRSTENSYVLDGAYNTDRNAFTIAVVPPMESVAEFRILTSLAPAEFVQSGGAVIDVVTKSGTQSFHGNAFEYFQNEAVDAKGFFEVPGLSRGIFRQNQYGATLGGPLAHSTYFFASYEGLEAANASATQHLVPDASTRSGMFAGAVIYDPLSLDASGNRTPFPNNTIPLQQLSPIAQKYLSLYEPLPNNPSGLGDNYLDSTPNQDHSQNGSFRVDRAWRTSNLFGRYTINNENGVLAGSFPERPTEENTRAQQVALGHIFSGSSWLSEARFSFTRLRILDLPQSAFGANVLSNLGINGLPVAPIDYGLPSLVVTNYDMVQDSDTLPQSQRDNTWFGSWSFSRTRGQHTFKAGAQITHFTMAYLQSQFARGQYVFNGSYTQDLNNPNVTGNAFADFLLGDASQTQATFGTTQAYLRQNGYAAFVQDDWRVSARITVNAGVRYEYNAPLTDDGGNLLNLNWSTLPSAPSLQHVNSAENPQYHDFAPRVGMAIRLPQWSHRDSVFRAGYGIFYSPEIAIETYDLIQNGVRTVINQPGGATPVLSLANGFPQTNSTGFPTYFGVDQNARMPYVQQWSASLQQDLPGSVLFELAYIGTKGTDLGRFRRFNEPQHVELGQDLPLRPGDLQSLRSFPELGTIFQREHLANSIYHSLQIKSEKRLTAGFSVLASFVWSKSIDNADSIIPGQYISWGAQNEANLSMERGLSAFNVPRRFSAGWVYSLPHSAVLTHVFSGWQISGNITLQDGTPQNPVYFATDFANSGTPNRPNIVPGQAILLPADQRNADHFYNPNAISAPAPFTFGDAGRDILPGPGSAVVDLSVHRRFAVTEHQNVEFRGEAFNSLNHPNLGIPGPYPDFGPFFGKAFSVGQPRRIQFALRYQF